MDARRLSSAIRAVRLRKGWRQADVARAARLSASSVSRAEGARITSLRLDAITRIAAALDIRIDVVPRWRGGELEQLLNSAHSAMQEQVSRILAHLPQWVFQPEVSFAIYGERGAIDILAFHPASGSLLVIELKTSLIDVGGLIAQVNRYTRLATRVATQHGWRATTVSCWVIVRDSSTNRRRAASATMALRTAFPDDGRRMRAWLHEPRGSVRAMSYLLPSSGRVSTPARRVRVPQGSAAR